jgi:hypothetical protein
MLRSPQGARSGSRRARGIVVESRDSSGTARRAMGSCRRRVRRFGPPLAESQRGKRAGNCGASGRPGALRRDRPSRQMAILAGRCCGSEPPRDASVVRKRAVARMTRATTFASAATRGSLSDQRRSARSAKRLVNNCVSCPRAASRAGRRRPLHPHLRRTRTSCER